MLTNLDNATTAADFAKCSALTSPITARQFVALYAAGAMDFAPDEDAAFAEITARAHEEAARLGVPHSAAGLYPAAVWALEAARYC
ncbi:hypothetical protein [Hyphomicrobium sulfonivorans]|uniref:hypothetical protein n=1 Tax=Hyphomicrobium sulfonivorans TaxID=121290 RepID=UPI001570BDEF|nr:hypothetical protein [Hyphomicrobium sulfonivorans]MBI1648337.1 hypothetical protein [Hyphomicrobium sulfonivorans]NSL71128.1 hypothetical protein [Hyphomicrobium sulfonivorans]